MPIYEYQCTHCGHPLEVFQKISESPLTECPNCGKDTLKKLISSTSFQLKGTGWYVTDIRDKNKPKATENSKTDTKPDTSSKSPAKETDKKESKKTDASGSSSTSSTTSSSDKSSS